MMMKFFLIICSHLSDAWGMKQNLNIYTNIYVSPMWNNHQPSISITVTYWPHVLESAKPTQNIESQLD